jgi:hypothetical protein
MDEDFVGLSGEPFRMTVELGKIREFARATKSQHPAYDGAPGACPVTPGTFLQTAVFWQGQESNPWHGLPRNNERLLHGEQEFVFHGEPPRAGTVLTGVSRIDKRYEKPGRRGGIMIFTETVTEFRDDTGQLVAEARGTAIETSKSTMETGR